MKKILVIEDHTDIRENLAEILELADYQVVCAENGKIGVEMAENEKPDLIICDVMMPVLDGFGALKILSQKPSTQDIPFIFLTAKTEKSDFRYGMNLGADDYIIKPFERNELLSVVEMRLKKYEKLQKSFNIDKKDFNTFLDEARGATALQNLAKDRESRSFRKKSIIYSEGTMPRSLFFVQSGKVKIYKTNTDGKDFVIDILSEGSFLGHLALLAGSTYQESAAALEDAELVVVPKEDFFSLVHSNRDVAAKFIKILANNIGSQEEQLLNLAYNSVRKKVADALVILHDRYGDTVKNGISILREDIAGLAGTAKETCIRTLADFKDEKLIEIEDGKIYIKNINRLSSMMN